MGLIKRSELHSDLRYSVGVQLSYTLEGRQYDELWNRLFGANSDSLTLAVRRWMIKDES